MTTTTATLRVLTLRQVLRKALKASTSPDPKTVADALYDNLSDAQYDEAARFGIRTLAVELARADRTVAMTPAPTPSKADAKRVKTGGRTLNALRHGDVLRVKVHLSAGEWKFLGDCTAADLRSSASWLETQAGDMRARARKLRKLADRTTGPTVAASMSAFDAESLLNA